MQNVTVAINGDIARVTIDNPPVNAMGQSVRQGLLQAVADLAGQTGVKAVVLCCAGRSFVAGADIRELGQPPAEPFLPDVLAAIEAAPVPWIAAIGGTALGGGLELAMACHGRVAVTSAKLGLPEVSLGIIPGAGGTVRLPRLVPMTDSVALVTGGKPIGAMQAHKIGLIDRIASDDLLAEAEALTRDLAAKGAPRPTLSRDLIPGAPVDWAAQEVQLRKRSRGASAPLEALAALHVAQDAPVAEALEAERARFLRLAASPEAAALRHIFFTERAAGKSLTRAGAVPADLARVGVVGGGTMGAGIATALLLAGSAVHLIERDPAAASAARGARRRYSGGQRCAGRAVPGQGG